VLLRNVRARVDTWKTPGQWPSAGKISGHDRPWFPGGLPGCYECRLLPMCCSSSAIRCARSGHACESGWWGWRLVWAASVAEGRAVGSRRALRLLRARRQPLSGPWSEGVTSPAREDSLRSQGRHCGRPPAAAVLGRQRHDGNRGTGLTLTSGGTVAKFRTRSAGLHAR
jgi:hypothetical protein